MPKDTSHPMGTALVVQSDYPKDAPKSFSVNVQITNPPGAPPLPAAKAVTPAAIPSPSPATH
jgi:hypothetical protein